jgi:hypothetical protein
VGIGGLTVFRSRQVREALSDVQRRACERDEENVVHLRRLRLVRDATDELGNGQVLMFPSFPFRRDGAA